MRFLFDVRAPNGLFQLLVQPDGVVMSEKIVGTSAGSRPTTERVDRWTSRTDAGCREKRKFGISRKRKKFAGRDQPGTDRGRDLEEDRAAFEDRGKCRLCVRMWWALSECGGQALSEWSFWVFSLEDPSAYWTHSSPTPRPTEISIPPKPQPFPKNVGRFSFLHTLREKNATSSDCTCSRHTEHPTAI